MSEVKDENLDANGRAKERVMVERLLANANAFYKNQENLRAFEAWKKNKEDTTYGTNHSNA